MFVGHLGAALALKRTDRRVSLGVLILGAMLPDLLLWAFVMLGIESVVVPPGFSSLHYLTFVFPYSHGLTASIGWSAAAGVAAWAAFGPAFPRRGRAAAIVAAAVFSHFILDALVHVPEMPVFGVDSPMIGLGLWNRMNLALGIELLIAAAGAWLCLRGSGLPHLRAGVLAASVAVAAVVTVVGMTVGPPPPTATAAALPAIVSIFVAAGVGFWIDRGTDTVRE